MFTRLGSPDFSAAGFVAPALAVLIAMNVAPMLWSLGMSFYRFRADRPHTPPRFVGLGNYTDALLSEDVWQRVQNTAVLMGSSVLLQVAVGGLLASTSRHCGSATGRSRARGPARDGHSDPATPAYRPSPAVAASTTATATA